MRSYLGAQCLVPDFRWGIKGARCLPTFKKQKNNKQSCYLLALKLLGCLEGKGGDSSGGWKFYGRECGEDSVWHTAENLGPLLLSSTYMMS